MWDTIQNLDWEAILSALLASITLTSLSIFSLYSLLKKIKTNLTSTKASAKELVDAGKDLVTGQKTSNETIADVKSIMAELTATTAEMQATYVEAQAIVTTSIEMLTDFKKTIENYKNEK